jgi:serine/threonine protein phosphatase 1
MTTRVSFGRVQSDWLSRVLGRDTRRPAVATGTRVVTIGDIHGRRDLLEQLMGQIADYVAKGEALQNTLVFLGDYVDRGPASRAVIDYLLELDLPGWKIVFLRGNHDQSLLDFLRDPLLYRAWRNYGAPETLLSYGVIPPRFDDDAAFVKARDEFAAKCPGAHVQFLKNLENMYVQGDYLFVHAGIRPGIPLDQQLIEDLLWIREDFLASSRLLDKVVVHGHTPTPSPVRRPNRLGLDTGAHATGCLTAAVLEGEGCAFLSTASAKDQQAVA